MTFSKNRMLKVAGLLKEGAEEGAKTCSDCGSYMTEDGKCECNMHESDKKGKEDKDKNEGETYEIDSEGIEEIAESMKFRRHVRSHLESMWASGNVFDKKSPRRSGVTMGFKGIGFK
jgi:uncharacterized Zn finger protein (UPF0148 family)